MQMIDEDQKGGLSEDAADLMRNEAEKIVKDANNQIELIKEEKEKELLTI